MKPNSLINILLGTAIIGSAACLSTEPEILPCDSECTVYLERFNKQHLPVKIYNDINSPDSGYSVGIIADTIRLTGNTFSREWVTQVTWPDVSFRFLITQWYDGSIIRRGNNIEVLYEYTRLDKDGGHILDTNRMYGTHHKEGVTLKQEPFFSLGGTLIYDGNGIFEYRLVKE